MGRARWLRGTAEEGRDGTEQSGGGRFDRERECGEPRKAAAAAADPARGRWQAPRDAEGGCGAEKREADGEDWQRGAKDQEGGADR